MLAYRELGPGLARQAGFGEKAARALAAIKDGLPQYRDSLGWYDPNEWAGEPWLARYEELAARVQKSAGALVVIGVGGSNQAARAMVSALPGRGGLPIVWAGNSLSGAAADEALAALGDRDFAINVIAKNFETLEPGAAFRAWRAALRERYGRGYASRVIATGTEGSRLEAICRDHGFAFLPFPKDIGGRYTALSPIGLFPAAVAGLDIRAVAAGARETAQWLQTAPAAENPAVAYAARRAALAAAGYGVEMLSFFEPALARFAKWWVQLFAESEGKGGHGLYPVAGSFSEDLHSVGQFIQEGSPTLFETFLHVGEAPAGPALAPDDVDDGFGYLDGKNMGGLNAAAETATWQAHGRRFPCAVVGVERLDERAFGQLFYFFAFACYVSCLVTGVNPFDQNGVEAYKRAMFRALGKGGA